MSDANRSFPGKQHVVALPSDPRPQTPIPSPAATNEAAPWTHTYEPPHRHICIDCLVTWDESEHPPYTIERMSPGRATL